MVASSLAKLVHRPDKLAGVAGVALLAVWRARRALSRLLAQRRFDVVVCHQAWSLAIFGPTIKNAALPLVFWAHTAGDGRHWLERWARHVKPDLTVSNSEYTAGRLSPWFPGTPIETIYCPLRLATEVTSGGSQRADIRGAPPGRRGRGTDRAGRPAGGGERESPNP